MLNVIYRLSDCGYQKQKPDYVTNEKCLTNFRNNFVYDKLIVLCDNCSSETLEMVKCIVPDATIIRTQEGNAGSFRYAMDYALRYFDDADTVYLVEGDYLHRKGSATALLEGVTVADFVTLYDHKDKYIMENQSPSYVLCGSASHWRTVGSTTMTFACSVATLRKSEAIVRKWCSGNHPNDYEMFCDLIGNGYTLISPIPGYSTHGETAWLSPLIDWANV